jgi:hypothetical protein
VPRLATQSMIGSKFDLTEFEVARSERISKVVRYTAIRPKDVSWKLSERGMRMRGGHSVIK